jgi:quinol-cytochrome oxidoreductase complex cytochrome b subunit
MPTNGLIAFWENIKALPKNMWQSAIRQGKPTSERSRIQAIFGSLFLHIHSTRTHPRSLKATTTMGLGIATASLFIILSATGILLMVYYKPSVDQAYDSIKDIHYIVPAGRFIRNIHRWGAHLMVFTVLLHMVRVFYTAAYKSPREYNWLMGIVLFVLTLGLSFTGYLLPWDQLAYWAITIGANIAASPNELVDALGLSSAFYVGDFQKEILLGASTVGQDALTRFYLLHVMVLPLAVMAVMGVHFWRIRKDGGLARPEGSPTTAGKGVGTQTPPPVSPGSAPTKTYGLMCVVRGTSPHTGQDPDETVPSWPYLLRAELVVFVFVMLVCVALGLFFDAPLKEAANAIVPENPAKAPWYFLGLQEMVSYSAFAGGMVIPAVAMLGLALIPYLDREPEPQGVWFSGPRGRKVAIKSAVVASVFAVLAVAIPVNFGWLRNWFPEIPQLAIILVNPGTILTALYAGYSIYIVKATNSTRMGAIALFTCFLAGFIILTFVGTYLRGPNWDFYWSPSQWPAH